MKLVLPAAALGTGLVALVAAPVLAFVVVPAQSQLPADTDTVREYEGTFSTLLNPAALTGGTGPALLSGLPASITKTVTVTGTDGDRAVVTDVNTVTAAGNPVAQSSGTYALDRTSLTGTDTAGLAGDPISPEGQTVSWPIPTEQQDYSYWVSDIGAAVPAVFSGTSTTGGVDTYRFVAEAPAAAITDPAVLESFPAALPKATLQALAAGLDLDPARAAGLGQLLAVLPDPVPLAYTYAGTTTVDVEPGTGLVLRSERTETRTAAIAATGATPEVPLTPVWALDFASTDASITAAAADATEALDRQQLFGTTVPVVLLVVGGVLVALGIGGILAARRSTDTDDSAAYGSTDAPSGDAAMPTPRRAADDLSTRTQG